MTPVIADRATLLICCVIAVTLGAAGIALDHTHRSADLPQPAYLPDAEPLTCSMVLP